MLIFQLICEQRYGGVVDDQLLFIDDSSTALYATSITWEFVTPAPISILGNNSLIKEFRLHSIMDSYAENLDFIRALSKSPNDRGDAVIFLVYLQHLCIKCKVF